MSTAALHYPGSTARSGNSGLTGLARLMWKEYRSLRWFWLAIVVLVVLMDYLVITFGGQLRDVATLIYNFALGAPVMFAIGAAGASFAAEKEEGTYEFFARLPPPPGKSCSANGSSSALATIGMAAVLWPISGWFLGGISGPNRVDFNDIVAFWSVAGLEVHRLGHFVFATHRPAAIRRHARHAGGDCRSRICCRGRREGNHRDIFDPLDLCSCCAVASGRGCPAVGGRRLSRLALA